MFCDKKIEAGQEQFKENETEIDFAWLTFIAMTKFGFTYDQVGRMYMGLWYDLFEIYKKQHNFEMKRGLYKVEEPVSSLSVL